MAVVFKLCTQLPYESSSKLLYVYFLTHATLLFVYPEITSETSEGIKEASCMR